MNITPLDIHQQKFRTRIRGFDIREVDAFLEQMAHVFESLQRTQKNMQEEVRRLEMEIQGYRKREETFKRALLNSQKVLDQMKDNARKSAERSEGGKNFEQSPQPTCATARGHIGIETAARANRGPDRFNSRGPRQAA